ncbi:transmembrane protein 70, mitochondrial-like [Anneissia japonica]|uniref:transmembrane protein 70, mitochondrial-like n=1 Tax=Anneissia japonica TaxID=1529436 RepID=UPI00142563CA|nr:transmembrane protein 70, mitochondrial-like [Anneissia japonica]
MYLVSSLKILQVIPVRYCHYSLKATNKLLTSKQILNLAPIRKQFATSATFKDRWDDPTSAYLKNQPIIKENVDRLIYQFNGKKLLQLSNAVFYGTALMGLYLAPDILLGTYEHTAVNFETFSNLAGITLSTVLIPLLARMFTKRIVLKLYHNAAMDTYTAHVFSPFLRVQKLIFHHNDIVVARKRLINISLTTVRAKKYPLFLQAYSFALPSDFNHLMGYDK